MTKTLIVRLRALSGASGQDLIEYALMAGFLAVTAGALIPGASTGISTIFSQVGSVLSAAAATGGSGGSYTP